MLIELKDVTPIRKQAEVEIPAEAIDGAFESVTGEFARSVKIPGFRPGKTPLGLVRQRFGKEIKEEVLDRLLPQFFAEALAGKDIEPIGNPGLKNVAEIEQGKPVRFVAEFEIKPIFELGEYRGIEVTETSTEVTEADVDQIIERYRDHSSTFVPVEGRGAEEGDYLVIDITSSGEDVETRTSEGYMLQLGEQAPLPELNDALKGKSPGDESSFDKAYGEDAPNEQVRNKTVRYDLKVRELKARQRPEMDDELAKTTGIADDLAQMREKIREDLDRHKKDEAVQNRRAEVGEALVARHQLEVPQAMLMDEMNRSMKNYARYLASQGIDLEKEELDWEKIGRELEPDAVKRVKRGLILESIAKKEGIVVSDVEVDAEIRTAIRGSDQEFAEVRHRLKHDGGYEALRESMAQEKALELILAEVRPVPAPAEKS